jgi:osmotically-inducible protein OsmY
MKTSIQTQKDSTGCQRRKRLTKNKAVPDQALIEENIKKAFLSINGIPSFTIKAKVIGNDLLLKGKVHSWDTHVAIANAAWNSQGVNILKDQIMICP